LAGNGELDVIAHSMGNEVLLEALKEIHLEKRTSDLLPLQEVVLAAPDVDVDHFEQNIVKSVLVGLKPRFTLYASAKDLALDASGWFQYGPRLGDISKRVPLFPPMQTIDATSVKTNFIGHSYYGDAETVLSDLFYLIRAGFSPDNRFRLEQVQSTGGRYWRFK
jgi:esterase/lipase superfamily enzyme